ncbi:Uncharacterised protein [Mesomycoplasma conjunctivae]|uniref:Uncharacterized protein n=1 Tax=Mesomycoplasma conjunctivae (strain ATCC 25834 / NCTC 10147 / HRC/581) TaxID=572263 RepID=C5J5Q3_MESCH|nr:hypothetical protein [Mesomycoplasma conjunctivae]CAT04781.1 HYPOTHETICAL PROTEIN MCJ_001020 [Mesomycoplasma conjunctivae]VEU65809.1 Uncharacterised protein [Mesomycoplasma conjunctivae]
MENSNNYISEKLDDFSKWARHRKTALIFSVLVLSFSIYLITRSIRNNYQEFVLDNYYFISFVNYFQNFSVIFYFTYQSNILLGLALLGYTISPTKRKFQFLFATTVMMTIVFIVFWTLIAWHIDFNNSKELFSTATVHFLHPILAVISLFWFRKDFVLKKIGLFAAIFYMFAYYIFCLFLYIFTVKQWLSNQYDDEKFVYFYTGLTIYPFLNFLHPFFYSGNNYFLIFLLNLITFLFSFILPYLVALLLINLYGIRRIEWKLRPFIYSFFKRIYKLFKITYDKTKMIFNKKEDQ